MSRRASGIHAPLSEKQEQLGEQILAQALGLSHISCPGCLRAASKEHIGALTEMFGYEDTEHNIYWTWMIGRARMIAQRDAIEEEPIPRALLERAAHHAFSAAIPDHIAHLPAEAVREPVLVAMLPVQPFGEVVLIDGNHRLLRMIQEGRQPMMQVLDPLQCVEALVTHQDQEEAAERAEQIILGAMARGIRLP